MIRALCLGVLLNFYNSAVADQVTFRNNTDGELLVRCISGGNVNPNDEYREKIGATQSHSRPDFARGKRAAIAWNADRSECTSISFDVRDGMTIVIMKSPVTGKIEFQPACEACSGGSSVSIEADRNSFVVAAEKRDDGIIESRSLTANIFSGWSGLILLPLLAMTWIFRTL